MSFTIKFTPRLGALLGSHLPHTSAPSLSAADTCGDALWKALVYVLSSSKRFVHCICCIIQEDSFFVKKIYSFVTFTQPQLVSIERGIRTLGDIMPVFPRLPKRFLSFLKNMGISLQVVACRQKRSYTGSCVSSWKFMTPGCQG